MEEKEQESHCCRPILTIVSQERQCFSERRLLPPGYHVGSYHHPTQGGMLQRILARTDSERDARGWGHRLFAQFGASLHRPSLAKYYMLQRLETCMQQSPYESGIALRKQERTHERLLWVVTSCPKAEQCSSAPDRKFDAQL